MFTITVYMHVKYGDTHSWTDVYVRDVTKLTEGRNGWLVRLERTNRKHLCMYIVYIYVSALVYTCRVRIMSITEASHLDFWW